MLAFFFFFFNLFMVVLGLHFCIGFSLVVESRSCSLVVVHGLLVVVASLVMELDSRACRTSTVAAPGL